MLEPGMPYRARLARLLAGVCLVGGFALFLGSGITPPGMLGEVIRHNRECLIDATPLFYSEVENMQELERGVAERREALDSQRSAGHAE